MNIYNSQIFSDILPYRENICAVFVTYHPDGRFPERVDLIARQVSHIIIVDNCSNDEAKQMLRSMTESNGNLEIIENIDNLGIATALNQGVRRALELGFAWALTMDQDTWPNENLVETLVNIYDAHPNRKKVKMIGANFIHEGSDKTYLKCNENEFMFIEKEVAITSGSLMSIPAFVEIGPFREDYFIDSVDHEYCLRLRSNGFKVILSCKPLMIHPLGDVKIHRFLWKNLVISNHSPLRRYYINRNRLFLTKEYFWKETVWISYLMLSIVKQWICIILFEDLKMKKLKASLLGLQHGILNRMGKLQENDF